MPLLRRRQPEPIDPDARSPQLGVKFKDLAVLQQLINAGARLPEPRHVLHYLYVDSLESAHAAAAEATSAGYTTEVREPFPEYPDQWLVRCERHGVVVDPATVRDTTDFFEELGSRYGGDYDGWEASV